MLINDLGRPRPPFVVSGKHTPQVCRAKRRNDTRLENCEAQSNALRPESRANHGVCFAAFYRRVEDRQAEACEIDRLQAVAGCGVARHVPV